MNKINVNIELCIVEWVFSLFSSLIPLDIQINFYEGFFSQGWNFFYKMCISVVLSIDITNSKYRDPEDVYIALKIGKEYETEKRQLCKKWNGIIKNAFEIELEF